MLKRLSFFLSLILVEWGTFGFDSVGTIFGKLESVQEILHSFHTRPQLFVFRTVDQRGQLERVQMVTGTNTPTSRRSPKYVAYEKRHIV